MQQPRQQRTYADLYSQQRSTSSSPVPPGGTRSTATSINGRSGAAAAAHTAASEPGKLQALDAAGSPPKASPRASPKASPKASAAVMAAQQKPSRIPLHPGQAQSPRSGASPGLSPRAGLSTAAHTAGQSSTPWTSPSAVAEAYTAIARHSNGAVVVASPSNGVVAAANGSASEAVSAPAAVVNQVVQADQQQQAAWVADSPGWSQDSSSTSSSDLSSCSRTRSSSKHGSKMQDSIHGDSGDEQCCRNGRSASREQPHLSHANGLQAPSQPQDSISSPQPLDDLQEQRQEQQAAGAQLEQQQEMLQRTEQQSDPQQQWQQQQGGSHANGGPGPPDSAGTAVAAAVVAAAAVAGAADRDLCSSSGGAAVLDSTAVQARMSADPDYELPQGKLTETQVLLAHGSKLRLDRYGFIVGESDMAGRTAGAAAVPGKQRSASQVQRERKRVAKWRRMLGSSAADFEAYCSVKMKKVKKRVRKGIPDEFRGYAWQLLSGGHALMRSHPGRYAQLVSHSPDAIDLEIMRDLNRTFPNHVFFHQRQGPGQQSLFHVLRAYSAMDKQVGYVQGMGFVTAILLMYMSEEAAFWTLVALLKGTPNQPPLEGLYQAGMPLLQQSLFQFHELLKEEHPRLGNHLEQEGVVPSMYCTHWFNTLFAYSLPFEQLLRVWDVFLLEGMKMVFRVGIALLASAQEQLCAMPFERLVAALNGRKFPILNKQPDALMKAALRIPVSKQLQQLRERFLALQAETQAAAAGDAGQSSAAAGGGAGAGAAAGSGAVGRSGASYSSKSSAAHAQQQLIAGFAPVPMGPNS